MSKVKVLLVLSLLFLIGCLGRSVVMADMGPKPTLRIEVLGIDEPYAFDLLVYLDHEAYVLTDIRIADQLDGGYYADTIPSILNGYQDEDGFASYTLYTYAPHTIRQDDVNEFYIGYFMAPSVFKIAIVTESGNLLVSPLIERTFFNASFVYDFTDDSVIETEGATTGTVYIPVGSVHENLHLLDLAFFLLLGISVTLLLEVGLLVLVGYRGKKTIRLVVFTNIATQFVLSIALYLGYYLWYGIFGYLGVLILGEVVVFVTESIIYKRRFKERHRVGPILYAILANILSLVTGFLSMGAIDALPW